MISNKWFFFILIGVMGNSSEIPLPPEESIDPSSITKTPEVTTPIMKGIPTRKISLPWIINILMGVIGIGVLIYLTTNILFYRKLKQNMQDVENYNNKKM